MALSTHELEINPCIGLNFKSINQTNELELNWVQETDFVDLP